MQLFLHNVAVQCNKCAIFSTRRCYKSYKKCGPCDISFIIFPETLIRIRIEGAGNRGMHRMPDSKLPLRRLRFSKYQTRHIHSRLPTVTTRYTRSRRLLENTPCQDVHTKLAFNSSENDNSRVKLILNGLRTQTRQLGLSVAITQCGNFARRSHVHAIRFIEYSL